MKSISIKYYISQISAIFVAVPLIVVSFFKIAWHLGPIIVIQSETLTRIVFGGIWVVLVIFYMWLWGWILSRIGFLPKGSAHRFPLARSWSEYEIFSSNIMNKKSQQDGPPNDPQLGSFEGGSV